MPSLPWLPLVLATASAVRPFVILRDEAHAASLGVADADVMLNNSQLTSLQAPLSHTPWAYLLGLLDDQLALEDLLELTVKHAAESNLTLEQGIAVARGHFSGTPFQGGVGAEKTRVLIAVYVAVVGLVTGIVSFIYSGEGVQVVVCILIYVLALATMEITVKWVFAVTDFQFPMFLTAAHMLCATITGFILLAIRSYKGGEEFVVPTIRELSFKLVPIASCIAWSVGIGNISLVLCSASFAEIVGATTPIVTVGIIVLMGMPFNWKLLGPTCMVFAGCVVSAVGEVDFSLLGFALCFVANVGRALKVVLQQEIMTGPTKAKFDPRATLAWMCACAFVITVTLSAVTEGFAPYVRVSTRAGRVALLRAILISCANAVVLNLSALHVTRNLGALGAQLVAQVKSLLTVLGGMVMFHDQVSRQEMVGFVLVMAGTYAYSRTEQAIKRARESEEKAQAP